MFLYSTSRVPVEWEIIIVCDVFEIYDNNTNYYHYQPGSNIIIVYFKHITHTVVIITDYKRMGYVIIPKPNLFELVVAILTYKLLFRRFGSICR